MARIEAFVIGLDDNFRGKELQSQLDTYGIEPRRVPGVLIDAMPGELLDYVDQEACQLFQRRELTKGEVGCALAHRSTWRNLLDSDAPYALVFEDDARLKSDPAPPELLKVLSSPDPTVILLDSYTDYTIVSKSRSAPGIYPALTPPPGAWAYALNRAAAEILSEGGGKIASVSDWPARVAHLIKFHVAYPQKAFADESVQSTLETDRHATETKRAEPADRKFLRLVHTVAHLRWFSNRETYRTYGVYWNHELRGLLVRGVSRKLKRTLANHTP